MKIYSILFLVLLIQGCNMDTTSQGKDFIISVVGSNYAEIKIKSYADSSFVAAMTYDANELGYTADGNNSIHLSTMNAGKYIVTAENKTKKATEIVNYKGNYATVTLYLK